MKSKKKPRLGNPNVHCVRELSKRGFDTVIRSTVHFAFR